MADELDAFFAEIAEVEATAVVDGAEDGLGGAAQLADDVAASSNAAPPAATAAGVAVPVTHSAGHPASAAPVASAASEGPSGGTRPAEPEPEPLRLASAAPKPAVIAPVIGASADGTLIEDEVDGLFGNGEADGPAYDGSSAEGPRPAKAARTVVAFKPAVLHRHGAGAGAAAPGKSGSSSGGVFISRAPVRAPAASTGADGAGAAAGGGGSSSSSAVSSAGSASWSGGGAGVGSAGGGGAGAAAGGGGYGAFGNPPGAPLPYPGAYPLGGAAPGAGLPFPPMGPPLGGGYPGDMGGGAGAMMGPGGVGMGMGEHAGQKRKSVVRTCAGEVWEDPTLADWPESDFRLFCGDLGGEVTDSMLAEPFRKYKTFVKARMVIDRNQANGKKRGYGFVSFLDPWDCLAALKNEQGTYIGIRPVKLRKSNWKEKNIEEARKKEKEREKKAAMGLR